MFNTNMSDIDSATLTTGIKFIAQQEAVRASINAANQAASLGISGGTNPFMFGMM